VTGGVLDAQRPARCFGWQAGGRFDTVTALAPTISGSHRATGPRPTVCDLGVRTRRNRLGSTYRPRSTRQIPRTSGICLNLHRDDAGPTATGFGVASCDVECVSGSRVDPRRPGSCVTELDRRSLQPGLALAGRVQSARVPPTTGGDANVARPMCRFSPTDPAISLHP
jgi:hypothetical protein